MRIYHTVSVFKIGVGYHMATELVRSFYNIKAKHQGGVLTIGNFDGVHLGHQQLVAKVVAQAKALQVPSLVVTFEPHAFEFFGGDNVTIPRLTRLREKYCALADSGVDYVVILPFNQELANLSASDFVTKILHQDLRAKHIIVGDDFHFGYKRQGDLPLLQSMGQTLGFSAEALSTVIIEDERVSSTRVRKTLAEGNHALVKQLLGRPYTLMGRVRRGDQRGRQWGFPTLNIYLHRKLTPVKGVYTVKVYGIDEQPLPGVANVGVRPTVDGTRTLLEVHLLDFNQEIYGRYVQVEFCEKLRDEKRYDNFELLKEQIAKDVIAAREYFKK
jgi:riboflavin kinase/FMN adenylyltransferase